MVCLGGVVTTTSERSLPLPVLLLVLIEQPNTQADGLAGTNTNTWGNGWRNQRTIRTKTVGGVRLWNELGTTDGDRLHAFFDYLSQNNQRRRVSLSYFGMGLVCVEAGRDLKLVGFRWRRDVNNLADDSLCGLVGFKPNNGWDPEANVERDEGHCCTRPGLCAHKTLVSGLCGRTSYIFL